MKRLAAIILWTFLFFALLLAVDQLFLRVPFQVAGVKEVRAFYVDFRARLFSWRPAASLPSAPPAKPLKKGKEPGEKRNTAADKHPGPPPAPLRYLFVDETGNLHFADSLEEVPARFRKEAKAMAP